MPHIYLLYTKYSNMYYGLIRTTALHRRSLFPHCKEKKQRLL